MYSYSIPKSLYFPAENARSSLCCISTVRVLKRSRSVSTNSFNEEQNKKIWPIHLVSLRINWENHLPFSNIWLIPKKLNPSRFFILPKLHRLTKYLLKCIKITQCIGTHGEKITTRRKWNQSNPASEGRHGRCFL